MATATYDLESIGKRFDLPGRFDHGRPWGSGHINDTFQVVYNRDPRRASYIFQRLNHSVFSDPVGLMRNVERVCKHVQTAVAKAPGNSLRPLEFHVCAANGTRLFHDEHTGTYWRVCDFVGNTRTCDIVENTEQAFRAARAFGEFQGALLDLPGGRLIETIPDFHHGPRRFAAFEEALAADVHGRAESAAREIDFALERRQVLNRLVDLHADGALPERITHNDCKLNNVLLDRTTGDAVCVIDLDTVMPGFVAYDFGDLVRTATSPAAEDETDLSRIHMQMPMFRSLARGYLEATRGFLTDVERDLLAFSGKLMTLTIGLRFLTDYLAGDVYFGVHRERHNLDRCRTQFALVESIEEQEDEMEAFVASL